MNPGFNTGDVLRDAWHVYVLLFRRSILVAGVVYLAIAGLEVTNGTAATVLGEIARLAGPVLVQGALVLIVRNVHEGRRPEDAVELGRRAGRRIVSLFGASLVYAFGVIFGLVALIVPGLLAASRWSLMAPAIMLENKRTFGALERSRKLVRGIDTELEDQTVDVLGVVVLAFLIGEFAYWIVVGPALGLHLSFHLRVVVSAVIETLVAPYQAHVLSVLYYRLTDPGRPAIDPAVRAWPSVWKGPV